MKTLRIPALLLALCLLCACGGGTDEVSSAVAGATESNANGGEVVPHNNGPFMAFSPGITEGILDDAYGQYGTELQNGVPVLSPAVAFENLPEGTVCCALRMIDPDAEAVAGYPWVHWLAANIPTDGLPEDASRNGAADMVQGANSFGGVGYGGPTPPDAPHTYVFTVYALDTALELGEGFSEDELLAAMEGHILATTVFQGEYRN